ncbi:PTS system, mannitol-specific IIB component [Agrilactobacillus composti DSM 18527 = JCM 14202]|nr:PTS system, mannitol-specific IIB component [Agrilactobacillus composti DSM 18527 = JCM 14202]
MFKDTLKKADKTDIDVRNVAVGEVEDTDTTLVIASKETAKRIKLSFKNVQVLVVNDIVNAPEYDKLISELK